MKASRFVKAFEQDVDKWEKTLSQILEVVETLLQVQKQWMYLEVCNNLSSFIVFKVYLCLTSYEARKQDINN